MELGELKNIYNMDENSLKDMTDEQWQKCFSVLRIAAKKNKENTMKCESSLSSIMREKNGNLFAYKGETQWFQYCKFINGILKSIRKGEEDYCFFTYQIADLLKFEPDKLVAKWIPENMCFCVSLN